MHTQSLNINSTHRSIPHHSNRGDSKAPTLHHLPNPTRSDLRYSMGVCVMGGSQSLIKMEDPSVCVHVADDHPHPSYSVVDTDGCGCKRYVEMIDALHADAGIQLCIKCPPFFSKTSVLPIPSSSSSSNTVSKIGMHLRALARVS